MELIQYVRDEKNQKIGVFVSNGKNSVGWSVCAVKKGDHFNRKLGLKIARSREAHNCNLAKVPEYLKPVMYRMYERMMAWSREEHDRD